MSLTGGSGFGQASGIEIGESQGLIPDPEWTQANLGREWGPGDSVQLAIGQASMGVTPLQVARFIAAVGNGGTLYQQQMVEVIQTAEGVVSRQFAVAEQGTLPVSQENLGFIQQAVTQVVREPKGTAYRRFLGLNIDLAGKTGTATSCEGTESHAWFAGYTFRNEPERPDIAVAVLVEYQGEGSEWAAPIFRRVIESYFFGRPFTLYPWGGNGRATWLSEYTPCGHSRPSGVSVGASRPGRHLRSTTCELPVCSLVITLSAKRCAACLPASALHEIGKEALPRTPPCWANASLRK